MRAASDSRSSAAATTSGCSAGVNDGAGGESDSRNSQPSTVRIQRVGCLRRAPISFFPSVRAECDSRAAPAAFLALLVREEAFETASRLLAAQTASRSTTRQIRAERLRNKRRPRGGAESKRAILLR